jgi:hypothetical protein
MNSVEKIKAAAAALNPDEQMELFRWWADSESFKKRQLAALKREIAAGIDELEHGKYRTYTNSSLMQLAEDVARSGRKRMKKAGKNPRE